MRGLPKGPMSEWATHLRHVADQLDAYQPAEPVIHLVWADQSLDGLDGAEETKKQMRKKYFALMRLAGLEGDKDTQLEVIEAILGRRTRRKEPITSRKDLTLAELGRVVQALDDWERIAGYAT